MTAETQTVPVEPTEAMLDAFYGAVEILPTGTIRGFLDGWDAMLAVAPAPAGELREAAQAVLDRWDSPLWKPIAVEMNRLRAALAAPGSEGE